jgi:hypothetical protein
MGLKKLQAQAAEARKEVESTIGAFVKEARAINSMVAQYEKKIEEISKTYDEMASLVRKAGTAAKSLNTHGIVQLDSMKRLIIVATEHAHKPHAVNLAEIETLEHLALSEIEKNLSTVLKARMDKIVASWPNKIEVGMVFKNGDRMVEIAGPQWKSTNINLKGDAALCHKVKYIRNGSYAGDSDINLEDLSPKKGWKFLKT